MQPPVCTDKPIFAGAARNATWVLETADIRRNGLICQLIITIVTGSD